ncbi:hypothetical protein SERLA73DRAFT_186266 [Serpula lacrymans var. lacrymans S7.3]|uniref:Uncharacterized protein n=1 Tax=Serpula lacrymans var. lacrymans (strain S7.3) TaxID=936435 RepID=F8Q717_SERL3|nr:hypothetical protein SERLA73DRAFT_186266 [Serpula lacrymans var. lacrymans S7.3]
MDSSSRMDQGLHSASSHPPDRRSSSSSPSLPEIPPPELDLTFSLDSILNSSDKSKPNPEVEKVQKRASNVFKLTQENEKLKEELRAMTARLEAAERKRAELAAKQAHGQPQSFKADGRF